MQEAQKQAQYIAAWEDTARRTEAQIMSKQQELQRVERNFEVYAERLYSKDMVQELGAKLLEPAHRVKRQHREVSRSHTPNCTDTEYKSTSTDKRGKPFASSTTATTRTELWERRTAKGDYRGPRHTGSTNVSST